MDGISWVIVGGESKKAAGRLLNGRTYDDMPPRVQNPVPERKERLAMIEQVTAMIAADSWLPEHESL